MAIALYLTNVFSSCRHSQNRTAEQIAENKSIKSVLFDTSNTALIQFDQKGNYPFDNSDRPATLTEDDINCVDSLLNVSVTEYNNSLDKEYKERSIDLKKDNYRKQLIAVTNNKGEKEVWINCFCHTWHSNRWKTEIMIVHDGGSCYFRLKVNLATKKTYDFGVNGEA